MKEENLNYCPECHGHYTDDEFDFEEGICLYCLFKELTGVKHR